MVVNYPSKSQKYGQTQVHKSMTNKTYPRQDMNYLNLVMPISFRNEAELEAEYRIKYFEKIKNYNLNYESVFLVVRMDDEYPYKAILINSDGVVLVSTTDRIRGLLTPSSFFIQNRFQESTNYFGRKFVQFNYTEDPDYFPERDDFIELYSLQDYEFLGLNGFTEYEADIPRSGDIKSGKVEPQSIEQEDPNYHSVERRYEDVARVYPYEGYTYHLHPEVLTGYPYMHYTRDKYYIDKPFAARNSAVIIRSDRNRDELVVMERVTDEEQNTTLRFLTGDEIFFYYNSEDQYDITTKFKFKDIIDEIKDGNIQS